jgi:hypothetical protein
MKFDVAPPLTPLLSEAEASFDKANFIVVVGFSFAEADVYISRMLSKSMQTSSKQRLLTVDPDNRIVERVRRKFEASIPNFDATRIIRMTGDCADLLPRFLSGKLISEKREQSGAESESGDGTQTSHAGPTLAREILELAAASPKKSKGRGGE